MTSIYLLSAPDQPGLVARVAGFFYQRAINIVDATNHTEAPRFYMRVVVEADSSIVNAFGVLAKELDAEWSVAHSDERPRVAILVTKDPSCLYDLVLRQRSGELRCEIAMVISNQPYLADVAKSFDLPFEHLPITNKAEQETQILSLIDGCDLVVLARYMQILSEEFLRVAPPVINIHHGFLPAFQGARPYHQAHERGVKIIGATAHYATKDLDQGPIIEQDVQRISHRDGAEEMVRIGRDVERVVLSRAVRAHLERRVIVAGRRTILL